MKSHFEARRRMNDPVAALPLDIGKELIEALRDACDLNMPVLFLDVAMWAQSALIFRQAPISPLAAALEAIETQLGSHVRTSEIAAARTMLKQAREHLEIAQLAEIPAIDDATPYGAVSRRFLRAILSGEEGRASREILTATANGARVIEIYEQILTPALHEAGRLWQRNEINVSEEHVVTGAVERMMSQLSQGASHATTCDYSVATVAAETAAHKVGARMVADAFSFAGWHSAYLGGNVPVRDLLDYVDRVSVDVLALSATLARDIAPIRALIAELETRPVAPLVIVGGRAFSLHPSLWRLVGADGYAGTPLMAVALANALVSPCNCE